MEAKYFKLVALTVIPLILSGCVKERFIKLAPFWVGTVEVGSISKEVSAVNFGVRKVESNYQLNVQLYERQITKKPEVISVRFKDDAGDLLWISWPEKELYDVELKIKDACAAGNNVEFCFSEDALNASFVLNSQNIYLRLKENQQNDLSIKPNETLTIDQLVGLARIKNFSSQKEAERIFRAKESLIRAKDASPRFNAKHLAEFATGGPLALVPLIGDLLPFAFPTYWFKRGELNRLYYAEVYSFASLLGNEMNAMETMVLSTLRDIEVTEFLKTQIQFLETVEVKAKSLEELGVLKTGSHLDFKLRVDAYRQDQRKLEGIIERELAQLAYSAGFSGIETPFQLQRLKLQAPQRPEFSDRDLKELALKRSLEIQATDFLIQAAQKNSNEKKFGFLDPSSQQYLNFSSGRQIKINKSEVRELGIERSSLEASVDRKVIELISQAKEAYDLYTASEQSTLEARKRFNQLITTPLEIGEISWAKPETVSLVLSTIENLLEFESKKITERYQIEIARAKMDRLRLMGFYEGL